MTDYPAQAQPVYQAAPTATTFTPTPVPTLNKKLLGGVIVALLIIGGMYYFFLSSSDDRMITVSGVAQQKITPSEAKITFTFSKEADTRTRAQLAGESEIKRLSSVLTGFGATEIIQAPHQLLSVDADSFRFVGGMQVTMSDMETLQSAVAQLNSEGITIAQTVYVPADKDKVAAELRQQALEDAKKKAQEFTKGSGARVGRLKTLVESNSDADQGNELTVVTVSENEDSQQTQVQLTTQILASFGLR